MTRWDYLPDNARVQTEIGVERKQPKYHNTKCEIDGIKFDSQLECDYYCQLKMLRMKGEVKDFDLQVPFLLQPSFKRDGKTIRAIRYIADFVVTLADGTKEVVDTKGYPTPEYKLKRKMLLYQYPNIIFREIRKQKGV